MATEAHAVGPIRLAHHVDLLHTFASEIVHDLVARDGHPQCVLGEHLKCGLVLLGLVQAHHPQLQGSLHLPPMAVDALLFQLATRTLSSDTFHELGGVSPSSLMAWMISCFLVVLLGQFCACPTCPKT